MQGRVEDVACFFYVKEGGLESIDARGIHKIGAKEALAKNCGSYVQKLICTTDKNECEIVLVYLHRDVLIDIYKDDIPSFLRKDSNKHPEKFISNELVDQFINSLFIYFNNPSLIDDELSIIKLKELILILLKSEKYLDVQNMLSELFSTISVEFKQAVENNLFNNISMEQLAFICNMSLSTFKRKFIQVYSETPARYIKIRRLEHSATLLLSNNSAIAAIAYDSGFLDVTTFSASFQDHFQISPSKYRLDQIRK
ncbi:AraC family transcriptional regulator [uncultured Winogradskyella sp.]